MACLGIIPDSCRISVIPNQPVVDRVQLATLVRKNYLMFFFDVSPASEPNRIRMDNLINSNAINLPCGDGLWHRIYHIDYTKMTYDILWPSSLVLTHGPSCNPLPSQRPQVAPACHDCATSENEDGVEAMGEYHPTLEECYELHATLLNEGKCTCGHMIYVYIATCYNIYVYDVYVYK